MNASDEGDNRAPTYSTAPTVLDEQVAQISSGLRELESRERSLSSTVDDLKSRSEHLERRLTKALRVAVAVAGAAAPLLVAWQIGIASRQTEIMEAAAVAAASQARAADDSLRLQELASTSPSVADHAGPAPGRAELLRILYEQQCFDKGRCTYTFGGAARMAAFNDLVALDRNHGHIGIYSGLNLDGGVAYGADWTDVTIVCGSMRNARLDNVILGNTVLDHVDASGAVISSPLPSAPSEAAIPAKPEVALYVEFADFERAFIAIDAAVNINYSSLREATLRSRGGRVDSADLTSAAVEPKDATPLTLIEVQVSAARLSGINVESLQSWRDIHYDARTQWPADAEAPIGAEFHRGSDWRGRWDADSALWFDRPEGCAPLSGTYAVYR